MHRGTPRLVWYLRQDAPIIPLSESPGMPYALAKSSQSAMTGMQPAIMHLIARVHWARVLANAAAEAHPDAAGHHAHLLVPLGEQLGAADHDGRDAGAMHGRVTIKRPRDALVLAQHALGRARVRQHIVDGAHALRVQACIRVSR